MLLQTKGHFLMPGQSTSATSGRYCRRPCLCLFRLKRGSFSISDRSIFDYVCGLTPGELSEQICVRQNKKIKNYHEKIVF